MLSNGLVEEIEHGELKVFCQMLSELPRGTVNEPTSNSDFSSATPFGLLLHRLRQEGAVLTSEGGAALRAAVEAGGDWNADLISQRPNSEHGPGAPEVSVVLTPFGLLLGTLVSEKCVMKGQGLLLWATATGADWGEGREWIFPHEAKLWILFKALADEGALTSPSVLELLDGLLLGVSREVWEICFDGGGSLFSEVVQMVYSKGCALRSQGVLRCCERHGASWLQQDGWNETPFHELMCLTTLDIGLRSPSWGDAVLFVEDVLQRHARPEELWNGRKARQEGEACKPGLFSLLVGLARQGFVGTPLAHQLLWLADRTGARWDSVSWNFRSPWRVTGKGRMTLFHELVDSLGQSPKNAVWTPDHTDIVSRAVEGGADFAIDDDSGFPAPTRFRPDVEELLWSCRRETALLLRMVQSGRALLRPTDSATPSQSSADAAGSAGCIVWLAGLPWRSPTPHPLVKMVLSFLPRVPPLLGYSFRNAEVICGLRKRGSPLNVSHPNRR